MIRLSSICVLFFILVASCVSHAGEASQTTVVSNGLPGTLRQSIVSFLNTLDTMIKSYPSVVALPLKKEINIQKKALKKKSLSWSTKASLSLLSKLLMQSHEITLNSGVVMSKQARFMSIGNLVFYAFYEKGEGAFVWNKVKKSWETVDNDGLRHLKTAWRIKKMQQPHTWFSIPVKDMTAELYEPEEHSYADEESIFLSPEDQEVIDQLVHDIYDQIRDSSLSLLLSDSDLMKVTYPVDMSKLVVLFTEVTTLLQLAEKVSYISLSAEQIEGDLPHRRFLFIGPFAVIADDLFFYKSYDSGLLVKAEEQPGLGLSLQANSVFNQRKISLLPVDPLAGGVLIKENNLSNFSDLMEGEGKASWALFFIGILICILSLFRLGKVGLMSWRVSRQVKQQDNYRLNNPLGKIIINCFYEPSDRWINTFHENISNEKKNQKRWEIWLFRMIIAVLILGGLLTVISLLKAMMFSSITAIVLAKALIPLSFCIVFCVFLLLSQAILIIYHQYFLLKLEKNSWNILFKNQSKV